MITSCTNCGGEAVAKAWCLDCVEAMCQDCVEAHKRVKVTRLHRILNQRPVDFPRRGSVPKSVYCPIHQKEVLQLYCFTCNVLTCRDCQLRYHRNHDFQFVSKAYKSIRKQMYSVLKPVDKHTETAMQSIQAMSSRLKDIHSNKVKLKHSFETLVKSFCLQFKERLCKNYEEVLAIYHSEEEHLKTTMQGLLEKVEDYTKRIRKIEEDAADIKTLLARKTEIQTWTTWILSQEVSPPKTMTKATIFINTAIWKSILSLGELQVCLVPFACDESNSPATPSATTCTDSPPLPLTALPKTGNPNGPAPPEQSVNHASVLGSARSIQPSFPPGQSNAYYAAPTTQSSSSSGFPQVHRQTNHQQYSQQQTSNVGSSLQSSSNVGSSLQSSSNVVSSLQKTSHVVSSLQKTSNVGSSLQSSSNVGSSLQNTSHVVSSLQKTSNVVSSLQSSSNVVSSLQSSSNVVSSLQKTSNVGSSLQSTGNVGSSLQSTGNVGSSLQMNSNVGWSLQKISNVGSSLQKTSNGGSSLQSSSNVGSSLQNTSHVVSSLQKTSIVGSSLQSTGNVVSSLQKTSNVGSSLQSTGNVGSSLQMNSNVGWSLQKTSNVGSSLQKTSNDGASLQKTSNVVSSLQSSSNVGPSLQKTSNVGSSLQRTSNVVSSLQMNSNVGSSLQSTGNVGLSLQSTGNVGSSLQMNSNVGWSLQKTSNVGSSLQKTSNGGASLQSSSNVGSSLQNTSHLVSSLQKTSNVGSSLQSTGNVGSSLQKTGNVGSSLQSTGNVGSSLQMNSNVGWSLQKTSNVGSSLQKTSNDGASLQSSVHFETGPQSLINVVSRFQISSNVGSSLQNTSHVVSSLQKTSNVGSSLQKTSNVGSSLQKTSNVGSSLQSSSNDGSNLQSSSNDGSSLQSSVHFETGPQSLVNVMSRFQISSNVGSSLQRTGNVVSSLQMTSNVGSSLQKTSNVGSSLQKTSNVGSSLQKTSNVGSSLQKTSNVGSSLQSSSNLGYSQFSQGPTTTQYYSHAGSGHSGVNSNTSWVVQNAQPLPLKHSEGRTLQRAHSAGHTPKRAQTFQTFLAQGPPPNQPYCVLPIGTNFYPVIASTSIMNENTGCAGAGPNENFIMIGAPIVSSQPTLMIDQHCDPLPPGNGKQQANTGQLSIASIDSTSPRSVALSHQNKQLPSFNPTAPKALPCPASGYSSSHDVGVPARPLTHNQIQPVTNVPSPPFTPPSKQPHSPQAVAPSKSDKVMARNPLLYQIILKQNESVEAGDALTSDLEHTQPSPAVAPSSSDKVMAMNPLLYQIILKHLKRDKTGDALTSDPEHTQSSPSSEDALPSPQGPPPTTKTVKAPADSPCDVSSSQGSEKGLPAPNIQENEVTATVSDTKPFQDIPSIASERLSVSEDGGELLDTEDVKRPTYSGVQETTPASTASLPCEDTYPEPPILHQEAGCTQAAGASAEEPAGPEPPEEELVGPEPLGKEPSKDDFVEVGGPASMEGPCSWPVVFLFRLPISSVAPGRPLPRFLVHAGDTEQEMYLEEMIEDDTSHDGDQDDYQQPPSGLGSPELQQAVCACCRAPSSDVTCSQCERSFHSHCHVPPGVLHRPDWVCSVCQDLSDPRDPYTSERTYTPCLSLLDQRKCEQVLLGLLCLLGDHCSTTRDPTEALGSVRNRLCHLKQPPYRTFQELISDLRVVLELPSTTESEDGLQLSTLLGIDSSLQDPGSQGGDQKPASPPRDADEEVKASPLTPRKRGKRGRPKKISKATEVSRTAEVEGKMKDTRKRLKAFLETSCPLPTKKKKESTADQEPLHGLETSSPLPTKMKRKLAAQGCRPGASTWSEMKEQGPLLGLR